MKLLYPFANVMGIFFPVGKLKNGGTCEFATAKCLKNCCAFDSKSNEKILFEIKSEIYKHFLEIKNSQLMMQIIKELSDAECNILSWFASGDCPSELEDKFYDLMFELDKFGIIQIGFTRNKELWRLCNCNFSKESKILLTIESIKEIEKKHTYTPPPHRLYAIPNYKKGYFDIYRIFYYEIFKEEGCGGGYMQYLMKGEDKIKDHLKLDCKACYNKKIGCFTEFN